MSDHENSKPLMDLYPFLHQKEKNPQQEKITLLNSIKQKSDQSITIQKVFFEKNSGALLEMAQALADVYQHKGRMLAMGNGGSSCDAAHFCVEFQHPVTTGRPALPAINLLSDMAVTSAVANDIGFKHVYARQLCAHGQHGDGLIGFSTSGNSSNLMAGYAKAKELGITTFGLTGGNGGEMKHSGLVDHCLVVDSDSIHRVQEVHVACYHILWDLTHTLLADSRGKITKTK
ncbi:MAG: SIS domain-containing protein [Methylococcales bacterium]